MNEQIYTDKANLPFPVVKLNLQPGKMSKDIFKIIKPQLFNQKISLVLYLLLFIISFLLNKDEDKTNVTAMTL